MPPLRAPKSDHRFNPLGKRKPRGVLPRQHNILDYIKPVTDPHGKLKTGSFCRLAKTTVEQIFKFCGMHSQIALRGVNRWFNKRMEPMTSIVVTNGKVPPYAVLDRILHASFDSFSRLPAMPNLRSLRVPTYRFYISCVWKKDTPWPALEELLLDCDGVKNIQDALTVIPPTVKTLVLFNVNQWSQNNYIDVNAHTQLTSLTIIGKDNDTSRQCNHYVIDKLTNLTYLHLENVKTFQEMTKLPDGLETLIVGEHREYHSLVNCRERTKTLGVLYEDSIKHLTKLKNLSLHFRHAIPTLPSQPLEQFRMTNTKPLRPHLEPVFAQIKATTPLWEGNNPSFC